MSVTHLTSLIEKLRQEQSFVAFYKQQIRQSIQELNNNCDQVFHSLWLSHVLSYGLYRVLTHNSYTQEWSHALSQSESVKFVNASKITSFHFVDRYSIFLTRLLDDPKLLSEILYHVETEGLDCAWVVSDVMGVVFGHCVFKQDHMTFLQLMRELLKHHIERCESSKDLFGGVESVFNHVLTGYCSQLVELRTFLTEVLREPIMQVLACEDYLEYDVNKAATRFQLVSEQNGLVSSSAFLFSEDLEASCNKLSNLAMAFLEKLSLANRQLPISLQWLLGNLRTMVKQKWPNISPTELRRPISDAIFSSILSSPIVNPESFGIVDPSIIISEVGRYNLSQAMSVLQGCVWIMDKTTSSKYPIYKVVRKIDVNLFFSLVDGIDGVSVDNIPELPSVLPGLKRSAVLASQEQLDNLVGLVAMLVTNREGKGGFHSRVSSLLSCLLPTMMEQACRNPYPITSRPFLATAPLPPPSSSTSSSVSTTPMDQDKLRSIKRRGKKGVTHGSLETLDINSASPQNHRTKIFVSPQLTLEGKGKSGGEKSLKRSISNETGLAAAATPTGFHLPSVVLVLPVQEKMTEEGAVQWDFDLLTEEEFMGQKLQSPIQRFPEDNFQFASLLHSHPSPPNKLDLATITTTPASPRPNLQRTMEGREEGEGGEGGGEENEGEGRVVRRFMSSSNAGGRVKSMIDAIEQGKRIRSNTLPSMLSDSLSDSHSEYHHHLGPQSEGASPAESALVLNGMNGLTVAETKPHEGVITNGKGTPTPAGHDVGGSILDSSQHNSAVVKPFTKQREHSLIKLNANTLDVSMEESASYVRVHPLPISQLGGKVEEMEEEEGVVRRGELAITTPIVRPDDDSKDYVSSCESTPIKDSSHLKIRDGEVVGDVRSPSSSPGLDDMSDDADKTPLGHVQNDSLQNLYQTGDVTGSPQRTSGRKKRKKKWRFFKKRKSTEEQVEPKYRRSHSDVPTDEVNRVELRDKNRSRSHNVLMDRGVGGARGRRQVDCYTIYMQDYTAKLEERKKLSPSRDEGEGPSTASQGRGSDEIDLASTDDDLDRGAATPPAEMSPLAFKQSLYCHQLKFKLRSALQNIHSSLSLSRAHVQLQEKGGVAISIRYQLILLVQHALQRSHWAHRDLETALLSEILRMVEPLPNEL